MSGGKAGFLGRFQPLHRGHYEVVCDHRDRYDEFVLVLGSPNAARTAADPLTAGEREDVLDACFPDVEVIRVEDESRGADGYHEWAARLEAKTGIDRLVSQNALVEHVVYEYTDVEIHEQALCDPARFSGTEVRRRIREGGRWRPLVPDCAEERIADYAPAIGRQG